MNRATILIASGAAVALMLAGTYVMASERATAMAQLNAETAKTKSAPAKAIVMQTAPTAALPTRSPSPRASESLVDIVFTQSEPAYVVVTSIDAEPVEPAPVVAVDMPSLVAEKAPSPAREPEPQAAAPAAPPAAAPTAAPPSPPPAAAAAPAAQAAPLPAPPRVEPRETPRPQPREEEHHEEHHEDHPEEHHEDHH
jgi:hypothetical protein